MWAIEGQTANWRSSHFQSELKFTRLQVGLVNVAVLDQKLADAKFLSVASSGAADALGTTSVADAYVRGGDLVVTYDETATDQIKPQLYWRASDEISPSGAVSVEAMLSLQTQRLDSRPVATIGSECDVVELLVATGGKASPAFRSLAATSVKIEFGPDASPVMLLARLKDVAVSYLEFVHPADFSGVVIQRQGDRLTTRHKLLFERLEKGVIRRTRTLGAFVSRAEDIVNATRTATAFLASPLPLTT